VDRHREEPVVTDRDRSVVQWIAVIGAVSAQDVMKRFGVGRTVGYRRLRALVDHGLLSRARLVYGQPALYVASRDRLAWAGMRRSTRARWRSDNEGLSAVRATRGSARGRKRCDVLGEPRLRPAELEVCRAIVSAAINKLPDGRPKRRRPDPVRFPGRGAGRDRSRAVERPGGGRRRSATEGALRERVRGSAATPRWTWACRFPCGFGRRRRRRCLCRVRVEA
jgi:hypothetical protein